MVETDLAGADAHGVFRLPHYVRRLRAGGVNPRPHITVNRTAPATALVDGDNGMGHLVMARAAETAVEIARETGVAWVGARTPTMPGCAGIYAEIPLRAGMIGIYSAVANANHMPVWGGAELLLGTNPIAFAIPAGEEPPLVLDIATTVVSYGTIKAYALAGPRHARGLDDRPPRPARRSPIRAAAPRACCCRSAATRAAGSRSCSACSAGVLNGAAFGRDVVDFNADVASATNTGHFIVALDVARFMPLDTFKAEVDRHLRDLRSSQLLPGFDAIRLPGERRRQCQHRARARRRADRCRRCWRSSTDWPRILGIAPLASRR